MNFFMNIEGCLKKYQDVCNTEKWLHKAQSELVHQDFVELIDKIHQLIILNHEIHVISNDVYSILSIFDPYGDTKRKQEFECAVNIQLAKERDEEERKKRDEEERKKREEAERQEQSRLEAEKREFEKKRRALIHEIRKQLQENFTGADRFFEKSCSHLIQKYEYESEKACFVQNFIKNNIDIDLDEEQALAVSSVNGHFQVIARAGSGKTRTLINRAFFLQKHCGIDPDAMLLLAFNKKAADEIEERLGKMLTSKLPNAMTFHALAYAIVRPEESIIYDSLPDGNEQQSRVVQQIIDDHLQVQETREQIRDLMLANFREDWDRIIEGGYVKNKDELLQYRRSLPRESLKGEPVKSFGEKTIANFLFEHNVPYKYERNYRWSGINYRPDFTIFKTDNTGVIIEYFGMKGDPDYDKMSQAKREYWGQKQEWTFLEFTPRDISSNGVDEFNKLLRHSLEEQGVPCNRLSEDEIWARVRERAIDRFSKAIKNFIGRCRKLWPTYDELEKQICCHKTYSNIEDMFLNIAKTIYKEYLARLAATGEEDFDGLMQRAADAINRGNNVFVRKNMRGDILNLRYVFVDEYQDFSEQFYRLLDAMRKMNPNIEFFCVGDDWQAINGFAGSDLRFFRNFSDYFGVFNQRLLTMNYRSSKSIVDAGNALMDGCGRASVPSKKSAGLVLMANISEFEPSDMEEERHNGDEITPIVLRLASKALSKGNEVALLCRRNRIPSFINYRHESESNISGLDRYLSEVRRYLPEGIKEKITIFTVHKYKGLEKPTIIVLDADSRSYPLIHPDWSFSRIFGDSLKNIIEEERRLFYVALTRATENLFIITDKDNHSPFLDLVLQKYRISEVDWNDFPQVQQDKDGKLVVKVGNQIAKGSKPTIKIKDQLYASGFRWRTTGWAAWGRIHPLDGFNVETMKREIWATEADGIEVRIYDENDLLLERYIVNGGKWIQIANETKNQ